MATIPTWPVVLTEWGANSDSNGGAMPTQRVDISSRTLDSESIKRGKQYELDTAQAGEAATKLRNDDAVLDPTNTGGPFASVIEPYQPFNIRAQYPATPNLLTYVQATGGEGYTTGAIPASFHMSTATDSTGGQVVSPGDAWQGTNVFQYHVNAGLSSGFKIATADAASVAPNVTYTVQMRIRCITNSVTGIVSAALRFYGPVAGASPILVVTGTVTNLVGASSGAGWTQISVTGTAPANACGVSAGVLTGGTVASAYDVQIDGIQYEAAASASTWMAPGTWYPIFSGFIERWPSTWKDGGTFGYVSPTVTDAFALLSQGQLSDPLTEEVNAAGATFLYRLNDPSTVTQAAEANGKFPPLNPVSGHYGAGVLTFGNTMGATDPVNGIFTAGGAGQSVVDLSSAGNGSNAPTVETVLSMSGSGIVGPQTPNSWTRMLAFRWLSPPSNGSQLPAPPGPALWAAADTTQYGEGNQIAVFVRQNTAELIINNVPLNSGIDFTITPAGIDPCDGNWHLIMFGYDAGTAKARLSIDGVTVGSTTAATGSNFMPTMAIDSIGGFMSTDQSARNGLQGQMAFAAEFPSFLSDTQIQNIYAAWRNACSGESSAARYSRILRYSGYTGTFLAQGGLTTNMGPASDLNGSDALTCLNNVVTTENGTHFVDASGQIRFQGRDFRYANPTPSYVFGEGVGEYPYDDLQLDFDSTHLASFTEVTNTATGQVFYGNSATAQKKYFQRTMTRSINVGNPYEAQDCANFLVNRYSSPLTRITLLKLNPGTQPALWPVALSLELGMCIQVNRRPFGCPEISLLMWIEQLQWDLDDKGNATLVLQCSPVNPVPQGLFAAWRTNLAAQALSGQPTITVGPPSFDTANPLGCYLAPGMNLTLGTETLTILSVSNTGTNWSTGTVTFTANLAQTHANGSTVEEQLPSGDTNPAAWDLNGKFDTAIFTY